MEKEKSQWIKWGFQDGKIGYFPDFNCIPQEYSRVYWNAFWDGFLYTHTSR